MLTHNQQADHYRAVRARLNAPRVVVSMTRPQVRVIEVPKPVERARVMRLYDHPIGPLRPALHQLMLTGEPGSLAYARAVLVDVSEKYGVTPLDVLSERRTLDVLEPRQEVMWRLRHETTWSLPKIGKFLGGRDHTTCLYGIRKHQAKLDAVKP